VTLLPAAGGSVDVGDVVRIAPRSGRMPLHLVACEPLVHPAVVGGCMPFSVERSLSETAQRTEARIDRHDHHVAALDRSRWSCASPAIPRECRLSTACPVVVLGRLRSVNIQEQAVLANVGLRGVLWLRTVVAEGACVKGCPTRESTESHSHLASFPQSFILDDPAAVRRAVPPDAGWSPQCRAARIGRSAASAPSSDGVGGPLRSPPTLHRCKLRRHLGFG
jgi:hypothetical protein